MCNHPSTYRTTARQPEAVGFREDLFDVEPKGHGARGMGRTADGTKLLIALSRQATAINGLPPNPVIELSPDGTFISTGFSTSSTDAVQQVFNLDVPEIDLMDNIGVITFGADNHRRLYVRTGPTSWLSVGGFGTTGTGATALDRVHAMAKIWTGSAWRLVLGGRAGNAHAVRFWNAAEFGTGSNWANLGTTDLGDDASSMVWFFDRLWIGGTFTASTPFKAATWDHVNGFLPIFTHISGATSGRVHVFRQGGKIHLWAGDFDVETVFSFDGEEYSGASQYQFVFDGDSWASTSFTIPADLFDTFLLVDYWGPDKSYVGLTKPRATPSGTPNKVSVVAEDQLLILPTGNNDGSRDNLIEWNGSLWTSAEGPVTPATVSTIFEYTFGGGSLLFDVDLLPETLAGPIEKQVRVFKNDIEGVRGEDWDAEDNVIRWLDGMDFGDRLTAFRETRWDKSWVTFNPTGLIRRNSDLRNFYKQRLFILQEVCDIVAISHLIGSPIILPPYVPDTTRPGTQVWTGGTDEPIPLEIELLPYSIAGSLKHQIVVQGQMEEDGLLITIPYQDSSPDADEWTEENGEIVFGADSVWGSEEWPIVIRRCTKADALWHRFQDAATFSSTEVRNVQKQIRFLMEEDWCPLVLLPPDHPLNNHIFPRPLNFITFQGPGSIFSFGQFQWLPGNFQLFINNLPVDDFDIDFFNWTVETPPLDFGDIGHFGPSGGPFSNPGISITPGGGGLGKQGDSEDEDDEEEDDPNPPVHEPDGIDWPLPPDPPGFFIPFWWDYSIPTTTPPFGNDSPGQFGAAGYVQDKSFGFKFVEFPTQDFPTGRVFIGLGRIQTQHIIGDPPPNGVGTWACLWTYSGTGDQDILTHVHALTASVPVPRPGWAIAIANWYANNLPVGHPLRALGVTAGSNPAGDEEEQTYGNPVNQAAQEFANQFPPGTDTTPEQFMDYMSGKMTGGGGFPLEP